MTNKFDRAIKSKHYSKKTKIKTEGDNMADKNETVSDRNKTVSDENGTLTPEVKFAPLTESYISTITTPPTTQGYEDSLSKTRKVKLMKRIKIEKRWKWVTIVALTIPVFIVSMVSMFHLINWFDVGHSEFLAISLAIAYELLTIATLISLRQLKQHNKKRIINTTAIFLWMTIFSLSALQVLGNTFSVFSQLKPGGIQNISALLGMSIGIGVRRTASILLGSILPITTLIFTKVIANYVQRETRF